MEEIDILGVRVNMVDLSGTVATIVDYIGSGGCHHVVTANAEFVVRSHEDAVLAEIADKSDLTVADGAGLLWAARIFGVPLPGRVPGVDLLAELLNRAEQSGYRVFLLGAAEGVAEMAAVKMQALYPDLQIVGTQHGFFSDNETGEIVERINATEADLLFVALGSPRQEKWISNNKASLRCSVAIGVGGSFDVFAGLTRRAPRWMGELGLEWLFRLIQEPRRIRRMLALPQFMYQVLFAKWTGGYRKL